jgi:hypothetical protein
MKKRAVIAVSGGSIDKKHFYRVGSHSGAWDDLPTDPDELDSLINSARKHIEPWLSAVFQAEHLNLLLGSGFTTAVGYIAGVGGATGMAKVIFGTTYDAARRVQLGRRPIQDFINRSHYRFSSFDVLSSSEPRISEDFYNLSAIGVGQQPRHGEQGIPDGLLKGQEL